jgi:hypothetical protein
VGPTSHRSSLAVLLSRSVVARVTVATCAVLFLGALTLLAVPFDLAQAASGTAGPVNVTVTPTTGLTTGDTISIHGEIPAATTGTISDIRAHICRTPASGPISNITDFGFAGPYCVKFDGIAQGSLGAGLVTNYENGAAIANTKSADTTFTAGTGEVGWLDDIGFPHVLTCDAAHPCDLVVQFQISVSPFTVYLTTPLSYAGGATTTSSSTTTSSTTPGGTTTTTSSTTTTKPPATTTSTTTSSTTTTKPPATTTSTTTSSTTTTKPPSTTTSSTTTTAGPTTTTTTPPGGGTIEGAPVPGGTLTAKLPGFAPDADVAVTLHSDPIDLGTVKADADGLATATFAVPLDFTGTHSVEGTGTGPAGTPITVSATFTVASTTTFPTGTTTPVSGTGSSSPTSALAFTGMNSRDLASVALLLMAVGLLCLDVQLRRSRA